MHRIMGLVFDVVILLFTMVAGISAQVAVCQRRAAATTWGCQP
jgi:hypothetical protein